LVSERVHALHAKEENTKIRGATMEKYRAKIFNTSSLLICLALVAVLSAGCIEQKASATKTLGINDIQSNPLAFVGQLTLNGVVGAFSDQDAKTFGLLDSTELMACKNMSCGAFMLPARYDGSRGLPKLGDEVNVTGSFVQRHGGYILFRVTKIEVKRNVLSLIS
jgi:hypothetical protein